ncbi:AAA family ATPase [uncultured Microbacterium sp.]|uniref:AAA family ATPase n=1 Tax=uncultured Microbacterium sp. TaxID=191216 RepID=UPI0028DBA474|nr:AAA family ATPase [uncultured Microbacterium sp.]
MTEVPIRRLMVSDFRRIEGTRELPFDAPIVLIHGSNGAGKTSVLSALELALTGEIRSMARQSDRYRAHLPHLGHNYATVRVDVAEYIAGTALRAPLTVNGDRLEGDPALDGAAAAFYSERCYLDQSSLGRLLELYQAREGNEQTALEKFVNELLGLEQLDALRNGLSDAGDFRLLKKLAMGADEADREAKAAAAELREQTTRLVGIRKEVASARLATLEAIGVGDHEPLANASEIDLVEHVGAVMADDRNATEAAVADDLHQELLTLRGRISAQVERPSSRRLEEAREALRAAVRAKDDWNAGAGERVQKWEEGARAAGVELRTGSSAAVERATALVRKELDTASEVLGRLESIEEQLRARRVELETVQKRLSEARDHSSALVEGLAAVRNVVGASNTCPVCDRDFVETGADSLLAHIDAKLAEIASHGEQLVALRSERDELAAQVSRLETEHAQLTTRRLPDARRLEVEERYATLVRLGGEAAGIEAEISSGAGLARAVRDLQHSLEEQESALSDEAYASEALIRIAGQLGHTVEPTAESLSSVVLSLLEISAANVARLADEANRNQKASTAAGRLEDALKSESAAVDNLAVVAEKKTQWDERVGEVKRRQTIAKDVLEAATKARANIVHRVFTESLNDVWKAVFTRLAPNEGFIPSFGVPSATKKTFDINLQTTHRNGEAGGPPQMMLSAGNLNTAALSLFLALHLAVDPVVPCLVFDDPVQAMDEVHVAQFAALIRLLAKQNGRQIIIAVHERELFDYLALELSPAFDGDELITIELGARADEEDEGITRHRWVPDVAIAN